jgi:adenylate cyclase class 2
MEIEYEATFTDIDKDAVRSKLRSAGAKLVKPEFFQKRVVFNLPKGHEIKGGWLRVRDEADRVTMSLKVVDGDRIENQKEICLVVSSFDDAELFLKTIGCEWKAYQESKREIWELAGVEIMIDEWPFLEPFVEIEGKSEKDVKKTAEAIGFDYSKAIFTAADKLIQSKYGLTTDYINNHISRITFDGENPFIVKK